MRNSKNVKMTMANNSSLNKNPQLSLHKSGRGLNSNPQLPLYKENIIVKVKEVQREIASQIVNEHLPEIQEEFNLVEFVYRKRENIRKRNRVIYS